MYKCIMYWSNHDFQTLQTHYANAQKYKLMDLLPGFSWRVISRKARSMGLLRNRSVVRRINQVDDMFFQNHGLIADYWAGFIAADGNIRKDKPCLRFKTSMLDIDHLELFRNHAKCEKNVRIYFHKQQGQSYATLDINGVPKWCENLKTIYGIAPGKTHTLKAPNLHGTRALAFIKGYIDGDGCVYSGPISSQDRVSVCGNESVLEWMQSEIQSSLGIHSNKPRKIDKDKPIMQWAIAGTKARKLCSAMRELNVPGLERKWGKI